MINRSIFPHSNLFHLLKTLSTAPAGADLTLDRTVLPIQLPERPLYTEVDARNALTL